MGASVSQSAGKRQTVRSQCEAPHSNGERQGGEDRQRRVEERQQHGQMEREVRRDGGGVTQAQMDVRQQSPHTQHLFHNLRKV